jgi:hypothetical protein
MIEGEGVCRLHKLEAMKRFAFHTEEEIIAKRQNVVRKFTVSPFPVILISAIAVLKHSLASENSVAVIISYFYLDAMMNNRHVLNKYLKSPHHLNKSMI